MRVKKKTSRTYYLNIEAKRKGPFTLNKLKNLPINNDTLLWTEGLQDWIQIGAFDKAKKIIQKIPPTIEKNTMMDINNDQIIQEIDDLANKYEYQFSIMRIIYIILISALITFSLLTLSFYNYIQKTIFITPLYLILTILFIIVILLIMQSCFLRKKYFMLKTSIYKSISKGQTISQLITDFEYIEKITNPTSDTTNQTTNNQQ
jgi:hypothetical protein